MNWQSDSAFRARPHIAGFTSGEMIDKISVAAEARSLLALLRTGQSADSIRELIGTDSEYRKEVRVHFDLFYDRLSRTRKRCRAQSSKGKRGRAT
jgi:hypothetical protein